MRCAPSKRGAGISGRAGGRAGRSQPGCCSRSSARSCKDSGAPIRWAAHFDDSRTTAAVPARQRILRCPAGPPICEDRARLVRAHGGGEGRRAGFRAGADRRRPPPSFPAIARRRARWRRLRSRAGRHRAGRRNRPRHRRARRRGADRWIMAMPSRGFGETLQAVGGHRFADVLAEPGDERSVGPCRFRRAWRKRRGAAARRSSGPRPQGEFLADLGIGRAAEQLIESQSRQRPQAVSRASSG